MARESELSVGEMRARMGLRVGATFLVLVFGMLFLQGIRAEVERRITVTNGPWEFDPFALPEWMPEGFGGELVALERLPSEIPLRDPAWRETLWKSMESNPWIDRVESITGHGDRISFVATFVRPVVGVRTKDGFLLVGSNGRVIDRVWGDALDRSWGIPEYLPERGPSSRRLPGESVWTDDEEKVEFTQLFAMLQAIGAEGVFDRWPFALRDVYNTHKRDRDRFWILRLAHGTEVEWGRSPASEFPQARPTETKVESLVETLRIWRNLGDAERVELWVADEPLIEPKR